jgi:hypothetical protein
MTLQYVELHALQSAVAMYCAVAEFTRRHESGIVKGHAH